MSTVKQSMYCPNCHSTSTHECNVSPAKPEGVFVAPLSEVRYARGIGTIYRVLGQGSTGIEICWHGKRRGSNGGVAFEPDLGKLVTLTGQKVLGVKGRSLFTE